MSFYYVTPAPLPLDESETLAQNTQHAEQAIAHLIEFFRRGPRTQTWLRIVCAKIQELETVFWDLYTKGFLATAEGAQLDQIGEIVNESRAGRNDDSYRATIRVRVLVNKSSGHLEELLTITRLYIASLGDASPRIVVQELWPAALQMDIRAVVYYGFPGEFADARYLLDLLHRSKAGGVRLIATVSDSVYGFRCGSRAQTASPFTGCGVRDTTGGIGGRLGIGR